MTWTLAQRKAAMEQFIASMAAKGSEYLERTKSRHVANTYGPGGLITEDEVKAVKARYRNELSFGEGK